MGEATKTMRTGSVSILLLHGAVVAVWSMPASPSMDCTTDAGFDILTLDNKFVGDIKVRTCADAIACTGNPLKPNHYNDCPAKLSPASSVQVSIDSNSTYLVFASSDKSIEFWKPSTGWPSSYDINLPSSLPLFAANGLKQFFLPDDPDPEHSLHCNDVNADTSDSKAAMWWSASSYKYADWASGLCPAQYNLTNSEYHPVDGGLKVDLRRMGRG